jgi:hypothetical protein
VAQPINGDRSPPSPQNPGTVRPIEGLSRDGRGKTQKSQSRPLDIIDSILANYVMQGDSRGRVPVLFLAYDDFFSSTKLNEKYDCQNPSGKRV